MKRWLPLILLVGSLEGKLPNFIKPCRRSDSNLSQCVIESTKAAVPLIVEGVKELNIPPLKKIKLPVLYSPLSATHSLVFDGVLEGLEYLYYAKARFNYRTLEAEVQIHIPQFKLSGRYIIEGYVGNIPISGEGDANIILNDVTYDANYLLLKLMRDGKLYYKIPRAKINWYEVKSANYHFENLFGGDAEQGELINGFLNNNWELLSDVFTSHIGVHVVKLILDVINTIIDSTPVDQLVLS